MVSELVRVFLICNTYFGDGSVVLERWRERRREMWRDGERRRWKKEWRSYRRGGGMEERGGER